MEKDLLQIRDGLNDAWSILKDNYIIAPDDAVRWDTVTRECGEIARKYQLPIITGFLILILEDIDRRSGEI